MSAPRKFRLSTSRLTALFAAIFAAGIAILLTTVYILTARVLDHEVDVVIQAEVNGLIDDYRRGGVLQLVETLHRRADSWGRTGAVYLLVDAQGRRIAGNIAGWPEQIATSDAWIEFEIDASEHGGVVAHPVRAQIFKLPSGRSLLVGTDILERKQLASRLRSAMIWGTSLCLALAVPVTYFYSQRVRRRIAAVATTCESIMTGRLSERLPVEGSHDEFDELAKTVNGMLDRIEQQTSVLRTTFDSAAHDLRAPLYRARVRIEEALQHPDLASGSREVMDATLAELDRVQRTLGTLLQIAQADGSARELALQAVDLAELAREIVDLYQPEASERGLSLAFSGETHAIIRGNQQLLAQALVNLVENALKYVPASGRIDVAVETTSNEVNLTVADNGPGVPAAEREHILQPFVRLERDRTQTGSGLGLSLVAAVMRLHRGTVELSDNAPGLRVACRFQKG
ncbi:signal transduction histidine kinase [Povalibacter uvarum]|uniref:histidine kinase n=1 Tax=Povalibacter uvarum TaxID=732238 RepID=A0A841HR27_9GAMM|nr:HAMP domain-containing sensor histidine kinase [Povalibacter uvarum]MBB6094548.1 signal transduction histidine kinase [Povalibacter uvarum]